MSGIFTALFGCQHCWHKKVRFTREEIKGCRERGVRVLEQNYNCCRCGAWTWGGGNRIGPKGCARLVAVEPPYVDTALPEYALPLIPEKETEE